MFEIHCDAVSPFEDTSIAQRFWGFNIAVYDAELAEMLGLTTATVSHHTSELHIAGLLNVEKQGNKIYYSKNQKTIDNLLEYMQKRL